MDTKQLISLSRNSRLILILIQYLSNVLLPDHDAGSFTYGTLTKQQTIVDKAVFHLFGGFLRWDAQYFMHITVNGYTYENALAFFPLYPIIVRFVSTLLCIVLPVISFEAAALLVFIALNYVLFIFAAVALYKLSVLIFDKDTAYNTVVIFCFNPASVFFSAPYAECLYCLLTFQSLLHCLIFYKKKYYNSLIYGLLFVSLSAVTRSNGVLNIGFFGFVCINLYLKYYSNAFVVDKIIGTSKYLFLITLGCFVGILPFCLYQVYCYQMFCKDFKVVLPENIVSYAIEKHFVLPGSFSKHNQSWCHNKIPLAYSYVQEHYWDVGLLKYYKLKQIPNFLLALPILGVSFMNCYQHVLHNPSLRNFFSLDKLFGINCKHVLFKSGMNVFVVHLLFLSLFCVLFVHIQVSTRILCSASPLVYWYFAQYIDDKITDLNVFGSSFWSCGTKQLLLKVYLVSYFVIGTVMFCNFLPWT